MAVMLVYVPAQVMSTSDAALGKPEGIVHYVTAFHSNDYVPQSREELEGMDGVPWEVRKHSRWCRTLCGKNIGYTHHSGQARRSCKHCTNSKGVSIGLSVWIVRPAWRSILSGVISSGMDVVRESLAETSPPTGPE